MSRQVVEQVEKIAVPLLGVLGLELVEVEYKKEGPNWFLRIYIDGLEKPVDLDDCAKASEQLSLALDEKDPIPGNYYLEVSSPGAERPLKKESDFQKAIGKTIHVSTYEPIDGQRTFEGKLDQVLQDVIVVNGQSIPRNKIASARLSVVFS
ncbi:ribosome maturation factor RimP [Shimazuella alba]|uniref:Ribosome maturation factor RimP n=1 Tax=Shimazuella alba TaxID=2690964 RepID=A0A6I4VV76_9BACL|nr:ribosome maturation factor RimP [Shimazuella alba]MXQ54903.1 ribosome maturation factor RimP [Shimazuella alba]